MAHSNDNDRIPDGQGVSRGAAASCVRAALPREHPQRLELNDEVHARPPQALVAPLRLTYLALLSGGAERESELGRVAELARRFGAAAPQPGSRHFIGDCGAFRLLWERHTEFTRYVFVVAGAAASDPFAAPAIDALPPDWIEGLPGELLVAFHVALLAGTGEATDYEALASRFFDGNPLIGSDIGAGTATALTDLRVRADGFTRLLVFDRGMTPRQAGRMVQRLLEIDTYRVLALLALPVARELVPFLNDRERELARITTALTGSSGEADESRLLDRLTEVEAEIESREADNHYRFGAASAYYELVGRRIDELREQRLFGLQTFKEFTERRLAPAMNTCRATAARQESLSGRVARATQLLSTRVDIARERQNQSLLASMDARAQLQLRLQQTVEGLSVAAVTYYVVGLVGYAARGLAALGWHVDHDLAVGVSIPVVAVIVALGVARIRHHVTAREPGAS